MLRKLIMITFAIPDSIASKKLRNATGHGDVWVDLWNSISAKSWHMTGRRWMMSVYYPHCKCYSNYIDLWYDSNSIQDA